MPVAQRDQGVHERGVGGARTVARSSRLIVQTTRTAHLVPIDPLVAGLPGRAARPGSVWGVPRGDDQQFLGAPQRMPVAQRDQGVHERGVGGARTVARSSRLIVQTTRTAHLVPIDPLVAGLPADLVVRTQLSHRPTPGLPLEHKLHSKIHGRTLLPRHRILQRNSGEKCYPCLRTVLLPMSPD